MFLRVFHGSIRKKLVILVLLATLPAFLLYFVTELGNKRAEVEEATGNVTRLLNGFSQIQQRITDSTRTLLKTIAAMPEVRKFDEQKVQSILVTLLKANPIYTNVILVDLKGNVVTAGKGVEKAKKFNFADRKQFKGAISSRKFSAGEFVVGKQSKKSIFPFGIPVLDSDGNPLGALIIGVSLNHYKALFEETDFYESSFFGVADSNGLRIFRYPMPEEISIGMPIKKHVFSTVSSASKSGILNITDSAGISRILAYTPLRLSSDSSPYMYMFMGLNASTVMQKADWVIYRSILTTLASLSLALLIAWFVGGQAIAQSLEKLADATKRLGQTGDSPSSGVDFSDGEVGYLAKTLDGMTDLLHKREVERNVALQRLSESEEQHRKLLEENPVGICLVNPNTYVIEFANPAFLNLLEIDTRSLGEVTVFQLKEKLKAEMNDSDFEELLKGRGWLLPGVTSVTESGRVVVADILSTSLRIRGQDYLAGFFTDITESKRFENELLEAKDIAEHANAAKDDFLANISHEVRTPLNGVMGMLQLMQGTSLDSEQSGYVDTGLRSSHSLMRVLDDLLDFSKIEAGMLDLFDEPFELEELLGQCIGLLKVQADERGIELLGHIAPATQRVYLGDAGRLRQVLFNLIGNAIKFTESGSITIDVYSLPHPDLSKDRLFFAVKDTGVGIPDDKISDIFESFTQVDGSRTRKFQGVGLGLSIVKRLVSLMNGTITIESQIDIGTTVQFCVLVGKDVAQIVNVADDDQATGISKKLNLLLVEDENVNRIMAKRLLEKMGHTVACAENGQECLDMILTDSYDVVLMDIQMPVMTGIEAANIIRTSTEFSDVSSVPIVALTAHATKGDMEASLESGMNEYVTKPFEKTELEKVLQKMVGL